LGSIYAEDGLDFEDEVAAMAQEFGLTVDEMKARLLECALPKNSQPAGAVDNQPTDSPDDNPPAKASGNGHSQNRFSLTS